MTGWNKTFRYQVRENISPWVEKVDSSLATKDRKIYLMLVPGRWVRNHRSNQIKQKLFLMGELSQPCSLCGQTLPFKYFQCSTLNILHRRC